MGQYKEEVGGSVGQVVRPNQLPVLNLVHRGGHLHLAKMLPQEDYVLWEGYQLCTGQLPSQEDQGLCGGHHLFPSQLQLCQDQHMFLHQGAKVTHPRFVLHSSTSAQSWGEVCLSDGICGQKGNKVENSLERWSSSKNSLEGPRNSFLLSLLDFLVFPIFGGILNSEIW